MGMSTVSSMLRPLLGLLTVANGMYSAVSSISTTSSCMKLTGVLQTLTGNLSFNDHTCTFSGAKPSQIGYARIVLRLGNGNDYYRFGMNGNTLTLN